MERSIIPRLRRKELQRLFTFRWGSTLPDDDAGRDDAAVMAHTIANLPGNASHHIEMFLEVSAPWMPRDEVECLLAEVSLNPRRFQADPLAERLGLTERERSHLGIRTIGAIDLPQAERQRRRRRRQSDNRTRLRRANGVKPRAAYEALSASKNKPWEAFGMSRRSWYRAGKPLAQV